MKRILILTLFLVLALAASSFAAPVTLTNIVSFTSSGAVSSGDGTGELISYGRGTVNQFDGIADYVKWSHSLSFLQKEDTDTLSGILSLKLRNEDNSWLPDVALGITDHGQWGISDVSSGNSNYNVKLDNGYLVVTLLSPNGKFFIDSSTLSVSYDSRTEPGPAPVPEPLSLILLGLGILMSGVMIRNKVTSKVHI